MYFHWISFDFLGMLFFKSLLTVLEVSYDVHWILSRFGITFDVLVIFAGF